MKSLTTKSHASSHANRLRIIGGRWRGTRLHFPTVAAIRPTPDRVRETLFNWLQSDIAGARCLDLFAGSGSLGLEALSRGANSVTFVDREAAIGTYLSETLQRLHCEQGTVKTMDTLLFLHQPSMPVDIVFLDPPFADSNLLPQICTLLEERSWLNTGAWIYIECPADVELPAGISDWPVNWTMHRSKKAGQVGYHLVKRTT